MFLMFPIHLGASLKRFSIANALFQFFMRHLEISNNLFWVISMFILAENCTEVIITCQFKMYISTFIRFCMTFFAISENWHFPAHQLVEGVSKPRRGAQFGNIRESALHHFVCHVSWRSPRGADWSCTGITLRHTLLYESRSGQGSCRRSNRSN